MSKKLTAAADDNPWAVSSSNYDINEFYTRSSDDKGHNENIQVKMPPTLLGEVDTLVASRQIPYYKSRQDFVRDAVVHRARWIAERLKQLGDTKASTAWERYVVAEVLEARLDQAAEHVALGQRIIDKTNKRVKDMIDAGRVSDAWDLVEEFDEISLAWKDETVYRHMVNAIEDWRAQLTGKKSGAGLRSVR